MKRSIILFVSLFMAASMITSCAKDAMEPQVDGAVVPTTRAYGDKTPKVMAYIEVNDTNPLNTMLYRMDGEPFYRHCVDFCGEPFSAIERSMVCPIRC